MCGLHASTSTAVLLLVVACSLLEAASKAAADHLSAVVVHNDQELLSAFQAAAVTEIRLAGPIKLGQAWDRLPDLLQISRNVTLAAVTEGALPQLDFAFTSCKLLLQPGIVLRIVGLEVSLPISACKLLLACWHQLGHQLEAVFHCRESTLHPHSPCAAAATVSLATTCIW
jgi:hypothetical protein